MAKNDSYKLLWPGSINKRNVVKPVLTGDYLGTDEITFALNANFRYRRVFFCTYD